MKNLSSTHIFRYLIGPLFLLSVLLFDHLEYVLLAYSLLFIGYIILYFIGLREESETTNNTNNVLKCYPLNNEEILNNASQISHKHDHSLGIDISYKTLKKECDSITVG